MKLILPNFICVGAQKAGTTSLHDILIQHPQIYLPKIKETKFFQRDCEYARGVEFYYSEYFSKIRSETCVGEIDPDYLYYENVPFRIHETLGDDIKIVFILRHPVDRAYSHYLMSVRRGFEKSTFLDAIKEEKNRIKDVSNDTRYYSQKNHFSYIDRGLYAKQIKRYLQYFKKENMHFIFFEDNFILDRKKTLDTLIDFLGVDNNVTLNLNRQSNPATSPKSAFLTNIVYRENKIGKFLKYFLPNRNFRKKIKQRIDDFNQKKIQKKSLEISQRKAIFDKYFMADVSDLEKLTGMNLDGWRLENSN